jgi:uncharacterized protein (DUF983 family)
MLHVHRRLTHPPVMRFWLLVARSLLLRCPGCGEGELFAGWFSMHERCSACGKSFEPEKGFYLGSIYFNYGLTAVLAMAAAIPLMVYQVEKWVLLSVTLGIAVLFPVWFFRYARSLWLGFDEWLEPKK